MFSMFLSFKAQKHLHYELTLTLLLLDIETTISKYSNIKTQFGQRLNQSPEDYTITVHGTFHGAFWARLPSLSQFY